MADLSKTIQIVFEGLDNTGDAITGIGKGIEDLSGSVQDATQPLANAAQAILAMETAALALGVAIAKVAVDEAGKFEQAITEINTVLGLTPDQLEQFKEDILDYASTSTQSIEQINAAVYAAVSAGTAYEDALSALTTAEQLAVAGNADLEDSIVLLTATTNAYGPALSGAEEAADIFFQTVQLGATTVPELNASLGDVIPVAAALGIPLEEVGAVLATVTTNGINTSQATTGLKAALSNIISPSKEAKDAAAELGVEFGAAALESDGLVGLLNNLYEATGGNAEEMKKLFGSTEAYTTVMSLTNDGAEKLNTNLEKLEGATGSTAKAAEEMAGSLENVNTNIGNSIDAVLIRMGDEVLDEYKDLVKSFAGLFTELADSIKEGSLDAPLGVVEEFLTAFSEMVDEIAAALPEALAQVDWSEFEAAVGDLGESLSGLFEGIDLTTPEGLAEAIQALVDTGSSLIEVTSGIIDGLSPLFTALGAAIKWFNDLDPEVKETAGYLIGLGTTVNTLAGVMQNFSGLISGAGGLIGGFTSLNPVVLAAATAFGAFKFGEWVGEITGYNEAWDNTIGKLNLVGETVGVADEALANSTTTLDEVASTLGVTSLSMEEFNQAVDDGIIKFDTATGKWVKASESASDLGDSIAETTQYFDDWGEGANLAGEGTQALAKTTEEAVATLDYWNGLLKIVKDEYESGAITQDEYTAAVKGVDDAAAKAGVNLVTLADAESEAAKSAKEAAEQSEKFALAWEELLSAERTAIFEASADIQVAQIEADAERAVAAMDMLSQSFQNTGDVLTELIGLWAGLEGMDQQQIQEWIEREYELREKLAQAQIDLIEAEIARMEAQTALLERGGVELTIQSDGLEPELEAFMFKIIDRIRIAVAGSYEEFLLGCGAGA